jgi:hypothetical protein
MSAPSPKWYDNLDVELAAALTFSNVSPGTPSAAQEIRLINNISGSGADPLTNARVLILVRDVGETNFVSGGKEYADRFYAELRVIGGRNMTPRNTPWTPMGAGRFFPLEEIANDAGIYFEIRINAPANANPSSFEVICVVEQSPAEFVQTGLSEAGADGIYHGFGDGGANWHYIATQPTQEGTPSDKVNRGLQVWVQEGELHTVVDGTITFTTAAANNIRIDLLSLKNDGTIEVTAGVEVTSSPVKPALPLGNLPLAYVTVDEFDTITDGDIEKAWLHGMFSAVGNGLNLEVGAGWAVIDNSLIMLQTMTPLPLTANDDNWVWLLRAGGFSVTLTDTPPEDRALLLYEATTDGSSITTLTDRRNFIGGDIHVLDFRWEGTLTVNDERVQILPSSRKARILPGSIHAAVLDMGGATSGNLRFLLEVDDGGFTSVFTTNEVPPEIAWNASPLSDFDAVPEVWDVPGHAIIKAEPDTLPSGGTPVDAILVLVLVTSGGK